MLATPMPEHTQPQPCRGAQGARGAVEAGAPPCAGCDALHARLARLEAALRHQTAALARLELGIDDLRGQRPAGSRRRLDPAERAEVLAAVHQAVAGAPFTARWLVDLEDPDLLAAIDRVAGSRGEPARVLGAWLGAAVGEADGWALEQVAQSRDGTLYALAPSTSR
jgi:hypothetical protein